MTVGYTIIIVMIVSLTLCILGIICNFVCTHNTDEEFYEEF